MFNNIEGHLHYILRHIAKCKKYSDIYLSCINSRNHIIFVPELIRKLNCYTVVTEQNIIVKA